MHNVEGMAFAIPINDVRKIAKELEHKGKVNYPNTEIKIKMLVTLTILNVMQSTYQQSESWCINR